MVSWPAAGSLLRPKARLLVPAADARSRRLIYDVLTWLSSLHAGSADSGWVPRCTRREELIVQFCASISFTFFARMIMSTREHLSAHSSQASAEKKQALPLAIDRK